MKRLVLGFAMALAMAVPATAASVKVIACTDDESLADARNIANPWEKNTKLFSNGAIRVTLLDTGGEPVCCSLHLMVLYPGGGDPNSGQDEINNCSIINPASKDGFVGLDFTKVTAAYDPKKGLTVTFPYQLYNDEGGPQKTVTGKFLVNSKSGAITPL